MASIWTKILGTIVIMITLQIGGAFQPSEKRILGSYFTVEALVFLFVFSILNFADQVDQIIKAIKQGNNNND